MYYNNDDIENNPMAWEDAMFDQADTQYERMSQRFNCEESDDNSYPEYYDYRFFEDYENVSGYSIDEYYDEFCAEFDENYYTEERFHRDFGSFSYENWLEMRLWEKNNPILCKEWLRFRLRHRRNLIPLDSDDDCLSDELWNFELVYDCWKKWVNRTENEREQLLDDDALYFNQINSYFEIDYFEWKDYLKWKEENPALSLLLSKTGYLGRFKDYSYVQDCNDLGGGECRIKNYDCWKMWNEKFFIYDDWIKSASHEQKKSFTSFVYKYTDYAVKNWDSEFYKYSYKDLYEFLCINIGKEYVKEIKHIYEKTNWRTQVHLFHRVFALTPFLKNFKFN